MSRGHCWVVQGICGQTPESSEKANHGRGEVHPSGSPDGLRNPGRQSKDSSGEEDKVFSDTFSNVRSQPLHLSRKHHIQQTLKTCVFICLLPNGVNVRVSNGGDVRSGLRFKLLDAILLIILKIMFLSIIFVNITRKYEATL